MSNGCAYFKVSEKLTDAAIAVRMHSDCRQALKQLEGPALPDKRIGLTFGKNL